MKRNQKYLYAVAALGSVLFHGFAILVTVIVLSIAARANISSEPPEPEPETVTLTFTEMPELTPAPTPQQKLPRPGIRTTEDQESKAKPEDAEFEAERDTKAASEKAPDPLRPPDNIPSVEGLKIDELELTNQNFDPQKRAEMAENQPQPRTTPVPKQASATPTPAPSLAPTPTPQPKSSATPDPEVFAMLKSTPTPAPVAPPPQPEQQPKPSQKGGTNTSTRPATLQGSVSLKGRTAVNASATPLGKYRAKVCEAIDESWLTTMKGNGDMFTVGMVRVKFYVGKDGRVQNLQLISNTGNELYAGFTVRSIQRAKVPPIPADVLRLLEGERLPMEYSFWLTAPAQ